MTVQYLSATELQRSASAATTTFSHTAPAGQRGILVGFARGLTSGAVSLVSYGGTTLVQYARATDTANEPGAAEWWYAPHATEGAQTVSYNQDLPGSQVHVVAISVGGDGTPYVLGSQTVSQNTTSLSVSLTTGYVSGLAFGALYWGGASPGDVTTDASQSLVHDWDMGAYGSKVTRLTDATTPGTGPAIPYAHAGGGDDVAWAVVFLTDGGIAIGTPQTANIPTIAGLAPTLSLTLAAVELTAQPGVGAIATAEQAPSLQSTAAVLPGVGSAALDGREPSLSPTAIVQPDSARVVAEGRVPGLDDGLVNDNKPALLRELRQNVGVGLVTAEGREPALATEEQVLATATPGAGSLTAAGLAPSLLTELAAAPAQGSVSTSGLAPELLTTLTALPDTGLVGLQGRAPSLTTTAVALPGVGAVSTQGRQPALVTAGVVLPGAGQAGTQGRQPALTTAGVALPASAAVSIAGRQPALSAERTISPALGAITTQAHQASLVSTATPQPAAGALATTGLAPTLAGERLITPDVGAASIAGYVPLLPSEGMGYGLPDVGAVAVAGLAPTLVAERAILPALGAASIEGRAPSVGVVVEQAVTAGLGAISVVGLTPTVTAGAELGGKPIRRRGRRKVARVEPISLPDAVALTTIAPPPDVPAYWDPPADAMAGFDTAALAARIDTLEQQRAAQAIARRRREEEELILILLRAA